MRLIDADALKEEILSWAVCIGKPHLLSRDDTMCMIDTAPTVDAVEVVHGRWIWTITGEEDYEQYYRCSKCNDHMYSKDNYCPNCGADMRERKDNGTSTSAK